MKTKKIDEKFLNKFRLSKDERWGYSNNENYITDFGNSMMYFNKRRAIWYLSDDDYKIDYSKLNNCMIVKYDDHLVDLVKECYNSKFDKVTIITSDDIDDNGIIVRRFNDKILLSDTDLKLLRYLLKGQKVYTLKYYDVYKPFVICFNDELNIEVLIMPIREKY